MKITVAGDIISPDKLFEVIKNNLERMYGRLHLQLKVALHEATKGVDYSMNPEPPIGLEATGLRSIDWAPSDGFSGISGDGYAGPFMVSIRGNDVTKKARKGCLPQIISSYYDVSFELDMEEAINQGIVSFTDLPRNKD